ncbi:hypothetical protein GN958_ATG22831 [Phytophthora infestans]|uniref:Uncharacterized protein n=1 Tax=Phytophthora infestans TaxID=4787 RepID=A0A8S9TJA6_PHYIN|nr:hypothetical protein GN958_ATG22831 [Phytophthora infestans]
MSPSDVGWQCYLNSVTKEGLVGKSKTLPNWEDEGDANNQEDDESSVDDNECQTNENTFLSKCEALEEKDELQQLRSENTTLTQRLTQMEKDHAVKLQQTIETHKQIEQRLRSQLQTVQHEQQAAADNARRVRSLLTRVSNWMRQVQHAAQRERSSIHKSKLVAHDLELRVTPRTESPYRLWSSGTRLATNVPECDESPTSSNKISLNQGPLQWPDSYGILIDKSVNPLPPPAPGRNRAKSLPAKGFSYVGYPLPSPPEGRLLKPIDGVEFVLDGLPSAGSSPRKVRKRSTGSLLAYCAHVVTTSLSGGRSPPSPQSKVTPAWKLDRLSSASEDHVDEEAGQRNRSASSNKPLDVALPNLSIGLL